MDRIDGPSGLAFPQIHPCWIIYRRWFSKQIINYRLAIVPNQLQGRVSSIARLILFGCVTIGPAFVGISLQRFGVPSTVGGVWVGLIFFVLLALFNRELRRAALPGR